MPELTRRWFLIGTSSAIAAAAVPKIAPVPTIEPFTAVPAQHKYLSRLIHDLFCSFDAGRGEDLAYIDLFVREQQILHWAMSTRASLRWVATPGQEIIVRAGDVVGLSLRAPCSLCRIQMTCHDKVDDGPRVRVFEDHTFAPGSSGSTATIFYLDTDNSLEARLKREEERKAEDARWEARWAAMTPEEQDKEIEGAYGDDE